jgi:hypothetical protein
MRLLSIILLFGNIICLRAQQTQLFQLDYRSAAHRSIELDSGMLLFFISRKDNNYHLYYSDGTQAGTKQLEMDARMRVYRAKNGVFVLKSQGIGFVKSNGDYITTNTAKYYNQVSTSGVLEELPVVENGEVNSVLLFDEQLNSRELLRTESAVHSIGRLGDDYAIGLHQDSTFTLNKLTVNGELVELLEIPTNGLQNYRIMAKSESHLLFASQSYSQSVSLWKTDLTEVGTSILFDTVLRNPSFTISDGDKINLNLTDRNLRATYVDILTDGKQNLAQLEKSAKSRSSQVHRHLSGNYYMMSSNETGYELAELGTDGIFYPLPELNEGPGSSLTFNLGEDHKEGMQAFHNPPFFEQKGSEKAYSFMTRGTYDFFYLYESSNGQFNSIFRIDPKVKPTNLVCTEEYAFWLEIEEESFALFSRRLDEKDPPQPEEYEEIPDFVQLAISSFKSIGDSTYGGELLGNYNGIPTTQHERDVDGNHYLGFTNDPLTWNVDIITPFKSLAFERSGVGSLVKLSPKGELLWMKHFLTSSIYDSYISFEFRLDKDGNVILFGSLTPSSLQNEHHLQVTESGTQLMKLNGVDGSKIWETYLAEISAEEDGTKFLTLDEDDNIYTLLRYYGNNWDFEDLGIPQNRNAYNQLILKFNKLGALQLISNLSIEMPKRYSGDSEIHYLKDKDQLVVVNGNLPLTIDDFDYSIIYLNKECEILDTRGFVRKEHSLFTSSTANTDGRLAIFGIYHENNFVLDQFVFPFTELPEDGYLNPQKVNTGQNFILIFNPELNRVERAFYSIKGGLIFLDVISNSEHIYAIGYDSYRNLKVLKFSWGGEFLGMKDLGQKVDTHSFKNPYDLTISDNELYVAGRFLWWNAELGIAPTLNYAVSTSVLKLEDENWDLSDPSIIPARLNFNDEPFNSYFMLYPNPAQNQIRVIRQYEEPAEIEVYNSVGQHMESLNFGESNDATLDISGYQTGVYIMVITQNGQKSVEKFVKVNY